MSDMTRYIDPNDIRLTADTLVDGNEAFVSIEDVRKAIQQTPSAEVVEKSELERCNKAYLLLKLEYAGFQAGALQIIKDLDGELAKAANRIVELESQLAGAVCDRDKAVADLKGLIEEVEKIRLSTTLEGDADEKLADLCRGVCKNYGENCFRQDGAEWSCKNFCWRGTK